MRAAKIGAARIAVIAATVQPLVMALQGRERTLAMIGMKACLVGLAFGQPASAHPGRDRHRQLADVMRVSRTPDVTDVGWRKTHLLGRRGGKRRDRARE